jgi:hypothetical protein
LLGLSLPSGGVCRALQRNGALFKPQGHHRAQRFLAGCQFNVLVTQALVFSVQRFGGLFQAVGVGVAGFGRIVGDARGVGDAVGAQFLGLLHPFGRCFCGSLGGLLRSRQFLHVAHLALDGFRVHKPAATACVADAQRSIQLTARGRCGAGQAVQLLPGLFDLRDPVAFILGQLVAGQNVHQALKLFALRLDLALCKLRLEQRPKTRDGAASLKAVELVQRFSQRWDHFGNQRPRRH